MSEIKFKAGTKLPADISKINASDIVMINNNMDGNNESESGLGSVYKGTKIVGTTKADELRLTSEITVAGGPLANDTEDNWPETWKDANGNKALPKGLTLQEILTNLFLKEVDGTVKWSAVTWDPVLGDPTATLSADTAEVGSTVTGTIAANSNVTGLKRSATMTASLGYFTSTDGTHINSTSKTESKDGEAEGTAKTEHTWNGTKTTSTTFTVVEGTNTLVVTNSGVTASVEALPATTVYASTNTKKCLPNIKATLSDETPADRPLTSTAQDTVTGSYYYFCGNISGLDTNLITSENVRGLNNIKGFVSKVSSSGTEIGSPHVNASSIYVIALPEGYSIVSAKFMGNPAGIENWPTKEISVALPNNNGTKKYKCWYSINGSTAETDYTNLIIKK